MSVRNSTVGSEPCSCFVAASQHDHGRRDHQRLLSVKSGAVFAVSDGGCTVVL